MKAPSPENPEIIRRWTLELDGPAAQCPRFLDRNDVAVLRVEQPLPVFNQFLHDAVGREFRWDGRDEWTDDEWVRFVDRPELETWVLYVRGAPAGYFETEHFEDRTARIHNFGLLRPFFGQGLGAHLLSFAARRAFERGCQRVWLRTCSKDHPHALPNYRARGFQIILEEDIPAAS